MRVTLLLINNINITLCSIGDVASGYDSDERIYEVDCYVSLKEAGGRGAVRDPAEGRGVRVQAGLQLPTPTHYLFTHIVELYSSVDFQWKSTLRPQHGLPFEMSCFYREASSHRVVL